MKIFVKLLAVFLAVSIVPLSIIGFVSYSTMQDLETASLDKMNTISDQASADANPEEINQTLQTSRSELSNQIEGYRNTLVLTVVAAIFGIVIIAYGFAYTLSNPIEKLRREMRDIAEEVTEGEFDGTSITVESNDEIGDLADSASNIITGMKYFIQKYKPEEDK